MKTLSMKVLSVCLTVVAIAHADPGFRLTSEMLAHFSPRAIGPTSMGGRITELAVVDKSPSTYYVAAASGGVWKTTNNGVTFAPVFDNESTASIGAVAVSQSNPDVVWVGTGEGNARNSVSWGDGVFKSEDGGKTWQHMGLNETRQIGRIVIHPKNPDVVYVAAVGQFWGPNKERGLYKTTDGGKTWTHSIALSENCGVIDIAMHPTQPDTLWAAAYGVRRDRFASNTPEYQFDPDAGLYKTTDGGKNWRKLSKGLPENKMGRIGLTVYPRDPKILYAVIQTERTRSALQGETTSRADEDPATGGIFRSDDGGESWKKSNILCPRPFYYCQIRVDPNDDKTVYVLGVSLHKSTDGGKEFRSNAASSVHPDHHAMWINPNDSNHAILGCDGGLNVTYDNCRTWDFFNNLPIAQFYAVSFDSRKPYWVYGGLQDNGSWGGPSATRFGGVYWYHWVKIWEGDGFYTAVDPTDWTTVYAESQNGGLGRVNLESGAGVSIRPTGDQGRRFNWSTPFIISPHNPRTLYVGSNFMHRSVNRGDRWQTISEDLTRGAPASISTLDESPVRPGILWAGTDDGNLWLSKNGGQEWTDLTDKLPNVSRERWISRVTASPHNVEHAFVAVDRHRNNDYKPYLLKTTDYGETWTNITGDLPANGSVYVVRQHPQNENLLFVGTEIGLYVSTDGGEHYERVRGGFPTVPVHDLQINTAESELVIATHGRGIYIMDIGPLPYLTESIKESSVHLFEQKRISVMRPMRGNQWQGPRQVRFDNPSNSAAIWYYVGKELAEGASIAIRDALGESYMTATSETKPGLYRIAWNHRGGAGRRAAGNGDYVVELKSGDVALVKKVTVTTE